MLIQMNENYTAVMIKFYTSYTCYDYWEDDSKRHER